MSTLSPAELRAQVETDYSETTLQLIIDAAERLIEDYVGAAASVIFETEPVNAAVLLRLPVKGSTLTTVMEYTGVETDPTETVLAADDYDFSDDGRELRRLSSGTNPSGMWGWRVAIVFVPEPDVARRKQAAIKLARLEIAHSGYAQERSGDWSATTRELRKEQSAILRALGSNLIT